MPRGRSGAMMSMGALGGSYPCAWAVVTKATSKTRRRVIPPRKVSSGSAWVILRAGAGAGKGRRARVGGQAAGFRSCCSRPDRMRCQDNRNRGLTGHAPDPEPRCDPCLAECGLHRRFDSASGRLRGDRRAAHGRRSPACRPFRGTGGEVGTEARRGQCDSEKYRREIRGSGILDHGFRGSRLPDQHGDRLHFQPGSG